MQIRRTSRQLMLNIRSRHSAQVLIIIAGLLLVACCLLVWRTWFRLPLSVNQTFKNSDLSNWQSFGGHWMASEEGIKNDSNEKGAKLVTGDLAWKDYEIDADVELLSDVGDAGVIIRSSDESRGVDSYNGYYIGFRPDPDTTFIGRADQEYFEYELRKLPGGVHKLTWYHLHVSAVDCEITAVLSVPPSGLSTRLFMKETACANRGRIGLRSFIAGALWKNIRVRSVEVNETRRLTNILEIFCSTIIAILCCLLMYIQAEHWRLKAVLDERTIVAREIHDTLAQSFAAIVLQLESIGREPGSVGPNNHNLALALDMARQSRKEAHVTIAALRNLSSDLSFAAIIENAAAGQLSSKKIQLRVSTQVAMPRFPADIETQLFRIAQEAVANAAQHSRASEITIDFSLGNRMLGMTIKDNGCGFQLAELPHLQDGHFGIVGMRERASAINAKFTISSDQHGTSISVSVPLYPSRRFISHLMSASRKLISRPRSKKATT